MPHKRIFFTAIALTVSILSISQCLYAQHRGSTPLPSYKVNEYPFNMAGKVSSGAWNGSGAAISQKVVLSCSTRIFQWKILWIGPGALLDGTYAILHPIESFDISSRSYRYFSDYAEATRRFQPDDPGLFSYEQFNLDVITLIFYEDVANGRLCRMGE